MSVKYFYNKIKNFNWADYNLIRKSDFFDELWYKKTYKVSGNGALHYFRKGYKLGYSPSNKFSRIKYELIYDDVRLYKVNPLVHFEKYGKYEPRFLNHVEITDSEYVEIKRVKQKQNYLIKKEYNSNLENLIIFLVPEFDVVSGGVMSINSIAKITKELRDIHHSEVIVCTVPNEKTFLNYEKFDCEFNIYRFEQLKKVFKNLKNVIVHVPEIYVYPFLYFLSPEDEVWLKKIKNTTINILNQNIDFMPRPRYVNDYLKHIFNDITITCAHKRYCVSQLRTSYNASVHLFSTSNLVKYKYVDYNKKENLLLYSPDDHPMKDLILNKIRTAFPEMELREIKNLQYKDYLKLIGKAKWMITFGEGLDGYFAESLRSGTLAFSVYNLAFFDERYKNLDNIYLSYNDMFNRIVDDINSFDKSVKYKKIVDKCNKVDKIIYNDDEYKNNIKMYYLKKYTFPLSDIIDKRKKLLERKPLISVAVATYNGEKYIKKQIESLLKLNYSNIEIIVSDDCSTDNTFSILEEYKDKIILLKNEKNHGVSANFSNALRNCSGEFVAFCDQDDIWLPDKLEQLLEHIDNFDIIHGGVTIIDENDNYFSQKHMHEAYEIDKTRFYNFSDFIKENKLLGCTSLIRKKFLDKFIEIPSDMMYHDWWFVLNSIKNGNGVVYLDKEVINYRQHGENTAYKNYNYGGWLKKKLLLNKSIRKYFLLSDYEKKILEVDDNYVLLNDIFSRYIPCNSFKFLEDNYNYLVDEFVDELHDYIEEKNDFVK